jgi:hypothetical protein
MILFWGMGRSHRGRVLTAWARYRYGQNRKRAGKGKIASSNFILYVGQGTEQADAAENNLISSPAKRFSSSFVWRTPAPGYAHCPGVAFLRLTPDQMICPPCVHQLSAYSGGLLQKLIWITRFELSVNGSVQVGDKEAL